MHRINKGRFPNYEFVENTQHACTILQYTHNNNITYIHSTPRSYKLTTFNRKMTYKTSSQSTIYTCIHIKWNNIRHIRAASLIFSTQHSHSYKPMEMRMRYNGIRYCRNIYTKVKSISHIWYRIYIVFSTINVSEVKNHCNRSCRSILLYLVYVTADKWYILYLQTYITYIDE